MNRGDADFHHPQHKSLVDRISSLPYTATIAELITSPLKSGFAAGKDSRSDSGHEAVPQIRPTQILTDGSLDLSAAYLIPDDSVSPDDYLQQGEVLFNNTNSTSLVGKSAVFRGVTAAVCSNHVTRIRLRSDVDPEYVVPVLNMLREFGYFARLCTNFNNQAGINADTLARLRIPFPDIETRKALVAELANARSENNRLRSEADVLLAEVDDVVLETLGLVPAKATRNVYAVGRSQLQTQLNPEYYHPERTETLRILDETQNSLGIAKLSSVVTFEREQLSSPVGVYLSLAHVQGHTGELTDSTDNASGACFAYQANDVLFARLRPYLNKVHCAKTDGTCSTEFHVLRIVSSKRLLPEYLATVLRSRIVLAQTIHMMTGNTHPRLTNDDVAEIKVPIPSMEIQEGICAEIETRRKKARQLRGEAETDLWKAKQWFEEQLLGHAAQ